MKPNSDEGRFLGWCQVTPWLETSSPRGGSNYNEIEAELKAFRWIRLLTDSAPSQQQQQQKSSLVLRKSSYISRGRSMSKGNQEESSRGIMHRRELRFAATAKVYSEQLEQPDARRADVLRWFYRPYGGLRRRRAFEANVLRLACVRAEPARVCCLGAQLVVGTSSNNSTILATRLLDTGDDLLSIAAAIGDTCSVTRLQRRAVFTQMLNLQPPEKAFFNENDETEFSAQNKTSPFSAQKKSKSIYLEVTLIDPENRLVLGTGRVRVAETRQKRKSRPDPEWIDLGTKCRVRIAWRWDYDETIDTSETRPFFDDELYGCELAELQRKEFLKSVNSGDKHDISTSLTRSSGDLLTENAASNPLLTEDEPILRPVNVLRVVVARARGLFPRLTGSVSTKRTKPVCGATVFHYPKSSAAAETRSTLALAPGRDGSVVWNECFEFALDSAEICSALSENIRLIIGGGEEFPPAELSAEAPRHRVKRKWYALASGGQVLVIAGRFQDDHLEANDVRDLAVDQLAMAFPEMDRSVLERVYESCDRRLEESCIALGSLDAVPANSSGTSADDKELLDAHLAGSNATDLDWIMSPLLGQSAYSRRPLAPSSLSSIESGSSDDEEDFALFSDDVEELEISLSPSRRRNRQKSTLLFSSSALSASAQRTSRSLSTMLGRPPTAQSTSRLELTAEAKLTMEDEDAVALKKALLLQDDRPKLIRVSAAASKVGHAEAAELLCGTSLTKLEMAYVLEGKKPGLAKAHFRQAFSSGLSPREIDQDENSLSTRRVRSNRLVVRVRTGGPDLALDTNDEDSCAAVQVENSTNTLLRRLSSRFDRTGFELAKIEIDVERAPRDFQALRSGLLSKLDSSVSLPALPPWVVRALRIKTKTRTASLAAGVATASIAAAVAVATGVAPVLAVSGGLALGAAALTGATRKTAKSLRQKLDADLARCTFLQDLQKALLLAEVGGACPRHKLDDAFAFFKLFLTHGGMSRVYQRAKRRDARNTGICDVDLDTLSCELANTPVPASISSRAKIQSTKKKVSDANEVDEESEDEGYVVEPAAPKPEHSQASQKVDFIHDVSSSIPPPIPPPDYITNTSNLVRPARPAPVAPRVPPQSSSITTPSTMMSPTLRADTTDADLQKRLNRTAPLPPPAHPNNTSSTAAISSTKKKKSPRSTSAAAVAATIPQLE
uniref:Uncharacterized protein n=1 Tax=Aureoumbra lagunensis TaxID=44058 RepID=A0A7S3K3C0_9STRA